MQLLWPGGCAEFASPGAQMSPTPLLGGTSSPQQHTPQIRAEGEICSQFQKALLTSVIQQQLLVEL